MRKNLNAKEILEFAVKNKHRASFQKLLKKEIQSPSDKFVKFFAKQFYKKPMSAKNVEQFKTYLKASFKELFGENNEALTKPSLKNETKVSVKNSTKKGKASTTLTEDERQGYEIVKEVLEKNGVDGKDISFTKTVYYVNILYKNKITNWITRLRFNNNLKKVIDFPSDEKRYVKYKISELEDIYKCEKEILKAFKSRK